MEIKWEKLKWIYCYVKHKKNTETDGYEKDRAWDQKKTEKERIK